MKLQTRIIDLHLRHTFTISRESQDVVPVVIAEVEHDGIVGRGEASPSSFYDETAEAVSAELAELAPWLATQNPWHYRHLLEAAEERLAPRRAALCALDLAVMDWVGRKAGLPLYQMLGLDPERSPPSSFTIGLDTVDKMVAKIREAPPFPVIKVKLGRPEDIEIMRALRREVSVRFRVDANCGWTAEETIDKSRELAALDVEFIEQPLPPVNLEAMEEVRAKSALPIVADENSVLPEDIPALAGRFDGINIKLVKCGGVQPALRMVELARTLGLKVMFGCMIESSIGCGAAAHLGPLADYLDLDGPLLIRDDPFTGLEYAAGVPVPPAGGGLGVEPR